MQLLVDGHEPEMVREILSQEIDTSITRHEQGDDVFRALDDVAPAVGMIGALIGLVQMLSNMDDPKAIGPAMAVALLTTLYSAIIAIALPLAETSSPIATPQERINRTRLLEGLTAIQQGPNPRVIEQLLRTYLPGQERAVQTPEKQAA